MKALPPFDRWNRWRPSLLLLAILSGVIAAIGHPPVSFPLATVIGMAVAVRLSADSGSWKRAAWLGYAFGAGYFLVVMHWLVEPFLVFPLRHGWLAPPALLAMAGGLAIFWSAAFGAAFAIGFGRWTRHVALAVTLTLSEALREVAFTGFPWGLPGYAWSATPVAGLAAHVGPLGLTFLTVLAAVGLLGGRRLWTGGLAALAGIALAWMAGLVLMQEADIEAGDRPVVRLVQPNVDQSLKWHPDHVQRFHYRLLQLTAGTSEFPPDVVVWPETAATFLLEDGDPRLSEIASAAGGATTVLGIRRIVGNKVHNSMVSIGPSGTVEQNYDKRKLVPFGEYVPFGDFLAGHGWSGLASNETGAFSPGTVSQVIDLPPIGRIIAIICYEAIFWSELRSLERPEAMIQITNDGWFGTFSGPQQHFEQARMRAIELGTPLIRVANTGISAVIDGKGNVLGSIALGSEGYLDVELPPPLPPTLFARVGHAPLLGLAMVIMGFICWRRMAIRR